jgi:16S rRNA (cytosine967-C5)-methyltransferase
MSLDCRAAAARVLGEVIAGKSLNQVLPGTLETVEERDRGLLQQLCYGTLRQSPRLQALLSQLLDKPLRDKDRDIQGLMLCGLYQLESMRTPDHAAVSATVQATKSLKKAWARGLVNAVLRRYLRERETLATTLDEAAAACHPPWLYQELHRQWPQQADHIIAANNEQPPMTLRINSRRTDRDSYLARLALEGTDAKPGKLSPQAIYLDKPRDVHELPGFAEGDVSIQDEAAQMAAIMLDPTPGENILDACSAPGGKTCHMLELQPEVASMLAMDSDGQRLGRVAENLDRLSLSAELLEADAGEVTESLRNRTFDAVLVDAPCSASGVIRRHPDIKLLRREADSRGFAGQQLRILQGVWPLLADGGRLLYVTCSVLQEENSLVIKRFLTECPQAELIPLAAEWGEDTGYGRQLLPTSDGPDGLFYALIAKRNN